MVYSSYIKKNEIKNSFLSRNKIKKKLKRNVLWMQIILKWQGYQSILNSISKFVIFYFENLIAFAVDNEFADQNKFILNLFIANFKY
jgi:hypothetical protein